VVEVDFMEIFVKEDPATADAAKKKRKKE